MDLISVIIVSWNARADLLACLQSIKETVGDRPHEIIVVDNASSDGSPQAVAAQYPEVELVALETNSGFAHANNLGMARSRGQLLFLINSDVVVHPGALDRLGQYMEENPQVGACGPRVLNTDGTLQPSCREFPGYWNTLCRALALDTFFADSALFCGGVMRYWPHDQRRRVDGLSGCFMVVRRAVYEQVGGFDERFHMYAEDVDWCRRFQLSRWEVAFLPEAQITHHGGRSSRNAPARFAVEQELSNLKLWRKYRGLVGFSYYKTILLAQLLLRILPRAASRLISRLIHWGPPARETDKLKLNWDCLHKIIKA